MNSARLVSAGSRLGIRAQMTTPERTTEAVPRESRADWPLVASFLAAVVALYGGIGYLVYLTWAALL